MKYLKLKKTSPERKKEERKKKENERRNKSRLEREATNKIMKNFVIFKKGSFVICIREIKV